MIWRWLIFLSGIAMIVGGVFMLHGPGSFSGVLLIVWGVGANTVLWSNDKHPLLSPRRSHLSSRQRASRLTGSPRKVDFAGGKIHINNRPVLILSGEVHYFRIKREDWADRLDKLVAGGLNTVATYIPWLWHELPDGSIDLSGRTHEQRDLSAFLSLCAERGLNVIARPGPFVMAELKNEGIPYRLYKDHPHLRPVTWDGQPVATATLDYLAPDFLAAVKGWYAAVMPMISAHLAARGGPIISVQLDNEIGMLSWVSNSPDLSDLVLEDMRLWVRERYGDQVASARAGADATDAQAWSRAVRSPADMSLALHHDLGLFMRERFQRYVETLRSFAEEYGVRTVPFLINVHGTGNDRARTFAIGISQLFRSYRGQAQITSGSDLYLGNLTVTNVADLYAANAFMAAMLDGDQPLGSLEFESGSGDYSGDLSVLHSPESVQLKTRLCLAQGNRLLNYYLYAGGYNPLIEGTADGIDRIGFTGERHGFAAPIGPEGQLTAGYQAIRQVLHELQDWRDVLADSVEEHDDFALGFVPDHYLSEYRYPGSAKRAEQVADLERYRGLGPREILARALLFNGFSFKAVNLAAGVPPQKALVLATGRTLGADVQSNLAEYVLSGGKLLLVGLLPDCDQDGNACTILADALGLRTAGRLEERGGTSPYWPSVEARGWAAPRPQTRVTTVQLLASTNGAPLNEILVESHSGLPCAVRVAAGKGEAIVLGCDYRADLDFYRSLMAALSVTPRWGLDADAPGVVVTSTVSSSGQRLLHLVNVAPQAVSLSIRYQKRALWRGQTIEVPARSGLLLPVDC